MSDKYAQPKGEERLADIIFHNGDIITMDRERPYAEALSVAGQDILAVGDLDQVMAGRNGRTRLIDLDGAALTPGLIEPHSHPLISALLYDFIDLSGFTHPGGREALDELRRAAAQTPPGRWLAGFGYDPILLRDLEAPTADDLDRISSEHPIFIMIQSMHSVFVNHRAFEAAGINNDTPQPQGGEFVKDANGRLTGMIIEQGGILPFMFAMLTASQPDAEQLLNKQMKRYARAGYTAVGAAGFFPVFPDAAGLMQRMAESDGCPVRISVMDRVLDLEAGVVPPVFPDTDRYRNWGVKLWYDGSPYTGNMFLDDPFLNSRLMQKSLGVPPDTCGYAMMTKEEIIRLVLKYHNQGRRIAIHGQGDRAVRDILDAF